MITTAFCEAVTAFKREFLTRELQAHGGNRTATARALGVQRTYLLRLIREFGVDVPPPRHRSTTACLDRAVSAPVSSRVATPR